MTTETIDIRCPIDPRRLFFKIEIRDGSFHIPATAQVACDDCKRLLRRKGRPDVQRVIHVYDLDGNFVESLVETGR